jgi:carbohydrate-binding DOMON domain-containing protein
MKTQYRLVQSGKTASGGWSAGQGSSEPEAPRIYYFIYPLHPPILTLRYQNIRIRVITASLLAVIPSLSTLHVQ